ncbi:accessory gene regulator ArgB-like protein [Paenibacillus sp. GCM10012307]|uniref:Accessory gene regulator B family protein n=1 Tax=Paenibacillus roseus TaxID=2798579 RepID=A0A934J759_9BACL|nr:accessory gene regulator B family protein [Paenibacillus roseus]MBJ6361610.1 accessory gene regulator B family protein [Paenibacillus roseus]
MIDSLAEKLAIAIKKTNEKDTVSVGVMKYALIIVINFLIPYTSALMIGLISGKFAETALSVLALILVRAVSGGYHFQSSTVCSIVTMLVAAAPPHIPLPEGWNVFITAVSFILFAIFAPANIKGYARMPEKYFPLMKVISLFIVGSNFFFQLPVFTMIFIIQALSLLFTNKKEVRT